MPKTDEMITYCIQQVSEKTGLKNHVLRYYEKEGLLPSISRTENGIRRYKNDDLELLGLICCLKNTGMSIKQIREFVELSEEGDSSLGKRCEKLIEHKKKVEEKIDEMQEHLEKVGHKINHFTKQYLTYCEKISVQESVSPAKPTISISSAESIHTKILHNSVRSEIK